MPIHKEDTTVAAVMDGPLGGGVGEEGEGKVGGEGDDVGCRGIWHDGRVEDLVSVEEAKTLRYSRRKELSGTTLRKVTHAA